MYIFIYISIWAHGTHGARWDPRAHMGPSGRALHGSAHVGPYGIDFLPWRRARLTESIAI